MSLDIRVDEILSSDKRFINVGGVTNHFTDVAINSNGRNYSVVFRLDRDGLGYKKETVHGVYDEYSQKPDKMQLGLWYNIRYKQTVLTPDKIKLEGWVNDKPIGEYIDAGEMTKDITLTSQIIKNGDKAALYSPIKKPNQVWTAGAYSGLYIRLTGTVKTRIKNVRITES